MKRESISKLVKESKDDSLKMEQLIQAFMPLIHAYARKLFFWELEDSIQELCLAVIEAVKKIDECENEGACIVYVANAVKYRYSYLCRKNLRKEMYESLSIDGEVEDIREDKNCFEEVEVLHDYQNELEKLSEKKKSILVLAMEGYTDSQISARMNVSRQYAHRVRSEARQLLKK